MIEVSNLVKRYGRFAAVDGVSFSVAPGEVVTLLGPNGAGKSTTIKAITGLIRPTKGDVTLAGFDIARRGVDAKAQLGYVPDRPYLYQKLTGRELLRFQGRLRKVERSDEKAQNWLEFFQLADFANELIETYSHGMRQKLTFIAALLHQPQVLVIDEPMVGLDPRAVRQVKDLVRDYANEGHTVLLTTHSMATAEELADRVLLLNRGQVAATGTMHDLQEMVGSDQADLEDIFLRLTEERPRERVPA